jgi:hypothetical protein
MRTAQDTAGPIVCATRLNARLRYVTWQCVENSGTFPQTRWVFIKLKSVSELHGAGSYVKN